MDLALKHTQKRYEDERKLCHVGADVRGINARNLVNADHVVPLYCFAVISEYWSITLGGISAAGFISFIWVIQCRVVGNALPEHCAFDVFIYKDTMWFCNCLIAQ